MSNETNRLKLDLSSIVSLKAELLRKQEEFRQQKQAIISKNDIYETHKTQSTWGKKKKSDVPTTSKEADTKLTEDEIDTEDTLLEKSKKKLETKAKYYEEVVSGKKMTEEGDEEIFLVNFDQKVAEEAEASENSNLKLKQEMDEEEYNKILKEKWEQESAENLDKGAIHYQDIRYNEIRNMGVGNYQFSRNEELRKQQMEFFKNIEKESKLRRISNEIYRLKREKILVERLRKVKQKRLLKFGYSLDEIKELCKEFENENDEIDKEILQLEKSLENPELLTETFKVTEETVVDEFKFDKPVKRNVLDREWDKPKLKEKIWVKHVEKLRAERNKMFAPPETYESNLKKKNKNKKRKNKTQAEDQIKEEDQKNEKNKIQNESFKPYFTFEAPPPPTLAPGFIFPPFPPFPSVFFPFPPPT
ncbi:unnamed protein product [Brachionus calyciflorus]|uniref:Coiled-coil domain-containing protein n=1 Tax=Brachionus calyciflorus TaxID=104777 RepID=A0A813M9G1_9BILA|nr:unnamed protein product [Brachionus calyciflorus]